MESCAVDKHQCFIWIMLFRLSPLRLLLLLFTQSCPTLCDPMDCSTAGFPVPHHLSEPAQTHVHWVGDAIQPSHPLSSASPPALNLSQHQGLFQWVGSSHQVAKVLELQLQSFQGIFRVDFLENRLVWSPFSPRDSEESYSTPQLKGIYSLKVEILRPHGGKELARGSSEAGQEPATASEAWALI